MSDRTELRYARLYDSVRTAHLERFARMTPATVLYRNRRYDFAALEINGREQPIQLSRAATFRHLLTTSYTAIEVNEPLMTGRWLDVAVQLLAVRLNDLRHRRHTVVGAYCIGRNDPVEKLRLRRRVPAVLGRPWAELVVGLLTRNLDRLAFGTTATWALHTRYAGQSAIERGRLFPAVAAACDCPAGVEHRPDEVLFVGAFTDRKGIRQLCAGWDAIDPSASLRLHVIGKGPLEDEVREWATGRPEVELEIDPPRPGVHAAYRRAHVLVLLSQRVGYWREQVGLPIVEGLAHGCEIVTTDETGLADWLVAHGHTVLPAAASNDAAAVAGAIADAARRMRSAEQIGADLPRSDPRHAADEWLLRPAAERDAPRVGRRAVARAYVASARRAARRYGSRPSGALGRVDRRPVFVVGSPRSGTSFTAECIGAVPGFVDLGELRPLKLRVGSLAALPSEVAAIELERVLTRAQRLCGAARRRVVEQTPESTFLIEAIATAYPDATFVHLVRDGRDAAASLLRLGWVSSSGAGDEDEVGQAFGPHSRFWVEPERRKEFAQASDTTRAAWVWRRYETAARQSLAASGARVVEVRYEQLVAEPAATAARLADGLDAPERRGEFRTAFAGTTASASGRWKRDLSAAQLVEIAAEAGPLLRALGYAD
jgi:glycosyltransferase involved in cell wall biosynthesis